MNRRALRASSSASSGRRRDGDERADAVGRGLLHSSKLQRLVMMTKPVVRSVPASASAPMSLSSALWRPTSSRTSTMSPASVAQAAPCTVRLKRFMVCRLGSSAAALRMAAAAGRTVCGTGCGDAHDVGDVLDPAQPAAGAALERAARHARVGKRFLVDGDVDGVAVLDRHGEHAEDIGAVRNDAFGEREADAEIGEVGRRRHHHRVGHRVDLAAATGTSSGSCQVTGVRLPLASMDNAIGRHRAKRGAGDRQPRRVWPWRSSDGHRKHSETVMAREPTQPRRSRARHYSAATSVLSPIRLFSRSRSSHSSCHSEGWLEGVTCTAVTLYSGQLVAQSEFSVVMTLAPVTG